VTPAVVLALGALLLFGLSDLVYKRAAAVGAPAGHFLMVQAWIFAPSVALYAALSGSLHAVRGALWGAAAGLFLFFGFYNFARSLRTGSVSVNAPVFRLSFVLTAALAIAVLGEPLTAYKAAGIAFALAAAWLLLGAPQRKDSGFDLASLARVLAATVAVGIGNFLHTLGLRAGATPGTLVAAQAAVVVSLATAFVAAGERSVRPAREALRYAPVAAVLLALAFVLMVEGMARGQASVVVPIAQMGFLITALAGFVALGERFTARKGFGIAAAVAALASLAHG